MPKWTWRMRRCSRYHKFNRSFFCLHSLWSQVYADKSAQGTDTHTLFMCHTFMYGNSRGRASVCKSTTSSKPMQTASITLCRAWTYTVNIHVGLQISTVYYLPCTFLFKTVGLALWYRTHRFSFRVYPLRFSVSRDLLAFFSFLNFWFAFFGFFICCYSNLLHLHAFCKFQKFFFGRELLVCKK